MTEITRRNVFAAAGGALALAACSEKAGGDGQTNAGDNAASMLGPCQPHGDLANAPNTDPFNPAFICAVYIRLEPIGTFTIRHAYDYAGNDPALFDAKATAILEAAKKANSNDDWKDTSGNKEMRKEIGFDNFTFGSRQLIYFFIDNDPAVLKFDARYGDELILRFSPFSAANYRAGATMKENHAFYNLKLKDLKIQGSKSTRAAVVQFWNTDENGDDIKPDPADDTTHYLYSMNLHMLMSAGKRGGDANNRIVPVILDPDGGNVGSQP